jgi:plastocyanin
MRTLHLTLLLLAVLSLAACAGQASVTPEIDTQVMLGPSSFVQTSMHVLVTHSVQIVDPAGTGGTHMLCWGKDGQCAANPRCPAQLRGPGMTMRPGDAVVLTFDSVGDYTMTCTLHPSMNLTISVDPLM